MKANQDSDLGDSFNGSSHLMTPFPVGQQTNELFRTSELKRTRSQLQGFPPAPPPPPVTQMSPAEIDSLISPLIRRRSEGFMQHEIKLMIEEIGKLRHILLSRVPGYNRLKKKAWEEVARNMALRSPHEPQRSGIQIKKKWENIVMKTKKKIREGQLTQEMEKNEITKMVTQFLAAASQEMLQQEQINSMKPDREGSPPQAQRSSLEMSESRLAFISADGTSIGNTPMVELMKAEEAANDRGAQSVKEENEEVPPNHVNANAEIITVTGSTNRSTDENDEDEDDDSMDSDIPTLVNPETVIPDGREDAMNPTTRLHQRGRRRGAIERELIRQSRAEHALRMKILQMKHRYWQLKTDSLQRSRNSSDHSLIHHEVQNEPNASV